MHTFGCGADAAFAVLVARSQSENRKLHDIAEEIAGNARLKIAQLGAERRPIPVFSGNRGTTPYLPD